MNQRQLQINQKLCFISDNTRKRQAILYPAISTKAEPFWCFQLSLKLYFIQLKKKCGFHTINYILVMITFATLLLCTHFDAYVQPHSTKDIYATREHNFYFILRIYQQLFIHFLCSAFGFFFFIFAASQRFKTKTKQTELFDIWRISVVSANATAIYNLYNTHKRN